ncbi:hypothetical protein Clacol_001125 [Clathrus columnatus]|uniref:Uncharacterized protein n=1 Tax=Clathrus columnatus TaxID=1419009 RepID=A0AAV4ZXQ2_9AGAM|nr:hypothetical protein Clacol_001125 [Clathrus columnatus]
MSQIPDPTNLRFQSNEQSTTILADCVRRLSLGPTTAELRCSASLLTVRPPTATRCDQPKFLAGASDGGGDPNDPDSNDDRNPGDNAHRPDLASPHNNQPQGGGGGPPNPPGGGPDPGPPSDPDDFDNDNYVNQESDVVRAGDLQEALNNIVAILESQQLIQTQQIARCIKAKEPETFDGTSFEKLTNFITQCQLAFWANLNNFLEDWQQIFYAISFLCGSALEYFQPFLEFDDKAIDEFEFFHDWGNFVQALTNAFGVIAPEDDAETALMDLTFGENGRAMSYFILFAKYTA